MRSNAEVAEVRVAEPAKLIVGAISGCPQAWEWAREQLISEYGPADFEMGPVPFELTDYYLGEMGAALQRSFLAFKRPIAQHQVASVKRHTNRLEAEIAGAQAWPVARPLNLDPGYVTLAKLVLASAKDHAHRIAVGEDIYAEVTLRFIGNRFEFNPWTYRDYQQESHLEFFGRVRESLRAELRGGE
jgi:Domain of unknown function (DUF4416)